MAATKLTEPDARLLAELRPQYELLRVLPDGSIAACWRLMFTRAIALGLDRWGFAKRFCFDDEALALQRFAELQSEDDEPQGYIARR